MNPLIRLRDFGQSVWYDNIRRSLVTSGELARMIKDYGLTGITSNPVIFEKAISGGEEYDPDIKSLAGEGKDADVILTDCENPELDSESLRQRAASVSSISVGNGPAPTRVV